MFDKDTFSAFVKERMGLATVSTATLPEQPAPLGDQPISPTAPADNAPAVERVAYVQALADHTLAAFAWKAQAQAHADYNFALMHHDQNIAEAVKLETCRAASMAIAQRIADVFKDDAKSSDYLTAVAGTRDPLDHACFAVLAYVTSISESA